MFKPFISILLLLLFTDFVYASSLNPMPYAALGDVIYNNVSKVESLKNIPTYKLYEKDINKYLKEVALAKEEGFALEKNSLSTSKKTYLNKLRKLSKQNDNYLREIKNLYKLSMQNNKYSEFSQIINSNLIDTQANKQEIIDYYYLHSDEINSSGVIDDFLEEDAALKALKDAQRKKRKSKKELQEEKIKRIRALDMQEKKKLELQLQKDLMQKKLKIRENQKKELSN